MNNHTNTEKLRKLAAGRHGGSLRVLRFPPPIKLTATI